MPLKKGEPIKVVDYDPTWRTAFEELSAVLHKYLGDSALAIEHVGSTAVPGLAAKPIIDINVVIESREYLPEIIHNLSTLGYYHEGDNGISGREAFARESADVPRDGGREFWPDHHLYVCAQDNYELARQLAFRDYLRSHPEALQQYAELKKDLAQRFEHNRRAYSEGKTEFVLEVVAIAMGAK